MEKNIILEVGPLGSLGGSKLVEPTVSELDCGPPISAPAGNIVPVHVLEKKKRERRLFTVRLGKAAMQYRRGSSTV